VFLIQSLMSQQWSPRLKKVVGKLKRAASGR
jgi:hypothetical protein